MDTYIVDSMANEGKPYRNLMLFGYVLAALTTLSIYIAGNDTYAVRDMLLLIVAYFLLGSIGLYGWLYALKYKLVITAEKITVRTLFKKIQIDFCNITHYSYKRYKKSIFYQFNFFSGQGNLMISTRYYSELVEILKKNGTKQVC